MENIEKRILSSNEWGLVALLHEGLLDKCKKSKEAIISNDYVKLKEIVNSIRDLLTELIVLFSENDEVSTDLRDIYLYINKLATDGEIKKSELYFKRIQEVTEPILEGFKRLEEKENPSIVSGLTYGKNSLEQYRNSGKEFKG